VTKDATGAPIVVGDRIGTIAKRRNPLVLTAVVTQLAVAMVTVEVLTAEWSGAPQSMYAQLPKPGDSMRLHVWRVFKLAPLEPKTREFTPEELCIDTYQPGNVVTVVHVPTGCMAMMDGCDSVLEAKAEAIKALSGMVSAYEVSKGGHA
jgi:hypothetical protein